ncbi:MAG: hypothetical protein QOC99_3396 [Acidobacteriota bacterium]|jgi:hypothetical protein|nr:hypothetical protein [Acidobacteriota bacterium]MDT7780884.1 hypothetical protein [Acidobacteriota bacterium]
MKPVFLILLLALTCTVCIAQEKGVDQQNDRIRDSGNNRQPAVNGGKVDTGVGRGMDFGKGRTQIPPPIPNPYRFQVPNDVLTKAAAELMRERKLILDDTVSKPDTGLLVSQPFTFTRGSVITSSELNRLADMPRTDLGNWTRGRYTIIIEIQPIDSSNTNVSVNARVEGRSDNVLGAEWLTLKSNGTAEQEFLLALIEKVTGGPPPGRDKF